MHRCWDPLQTHETKTSILEEYFKKRSAIPLVKPLNFLHPDDLLVLEDKSGRVKLRGDAILPFVYVTGIVVILHGKEIGADDFWVEDGLEAGLLHQIERLIKSGVNVGRGSSNPLKFQLLINHITGHLGDEKEQSIAANIVQVDCKKFC